MGKTKIPEFDNKRMIGDNWQRVIDSAQRYYRPGKFTTFVAFEWSAMPDGAHIHRNVIFRGPNFPMMPYSAVDSMHPEDLWRYAEDNRRRGIDSILIPHNSNLSDGLMFSYKDSFGREMSRAYAEARARNEMAVEINQTKGASETTPQLSPQDEFAGYEILRTPKSVDDGSYVRQGLQRGMELREKLKVNPFKLGIVGGSDSHSGMSATEESNYVLGVTGAGPSEAQATSVLNDKNPITSTKLTVLSAAGLTGVWAERNTREALFDALRRKEVFGTSGTRIQVRLFGGWNFPGGLQKRSDWVAEAYRTGVPMGGDLPALTPGKAPRFLVQALKDPDGANLDRIQIVKLWYKDGRSHEKIFEVAWSGLRRPDPATGKLPPVGSTVNIDAATYSNTLGASELHGAWADPEFDPASPAIYYARVLEIPTPRWPAYMAARHKLKLPADVVGQLQERAWTSPIFYEP
jgi:hypothetical protein